MYTIYVRASVDIISVVLDLDDDAPVDRDRNRVSIFYIQTLPSASTGDI